MNHLIGSALYRLKRLALALVRVAFFLFGFSCIFIAPFMVVGGISAIDEGPGMVVLGVVSCAVLILAGFGLIRIARTMGKRGDDPASRPTVVAVEPISHVISGPETRRTAAAPAAASTGTPPRPVALRTTAAPAAAPEQAPAAAPEQAPERDQLELMLLRSDNPVATLKDVAAHGDGIATPGLIALLENAGIAEWQDAPAVGLSRLTRSKRWWFHMAPGLLDEADRNRFIALEAALNAAYDARANGLGAGAEGAAQMLALTAGLPLEENEQTEAYRTGSADGEWAFRVRFCDLAENVRTVYRSFFTLIANTGAHAADVLVEVPAPEAFAPFSQDAAVLPRLAREYALDLAALYARMVFSADSSMRRARVRCRLEEADELLFRLDVSPAQLDEAMAALREGDADLELLASAPWMHFELDEKGWFVPQEDPRKQDSAVFDPPERHKFPELNADPAGSEIRDACGARSISDLGINENAGRIAAWNRINAVKDGSTEDLVGRIMAEREVANDFTVIEACDRVSKELVEGGLDVTDRQKIAERFAFGSALEALVARAQAAFDNPQENNPEPALEALLAGLSPLMQTGLYLDDSESVYRYFNSANDRLAFNLDIDDRSRTVRLVPDAYYRAHSLAARLLSMVGREDEALPYIDELMRIAPATTDAILIKVRWLENKGRIFEAADLLRQAIDTAPTARDMATCHYRLAYMQWKLGRSDLAVACYERAANLRQQMSPQAEEELADLLADDPSLKRHESDSEVQAVLEGAGIPYGAIAKLRMRTLNAAKACADAGIFPTAGHLTGALMELSRDDALSGIYRSLTSEL